MNSSMFDLTPTPASTVHVPGMVVVAASNVQTQPSSPYVVVRTQSVSATGTPGHVVSVGGAVVVGPFLWYLYFGIGVGAGLAIAAAAKSAVI